MRRVMAFLLIGAFALTGALFAQGTAFGAARNLALATASTGGSWYPTGVLLAQLWTEKVSGVKVTANPTKGSVQNCDLLRRDQVDLTFMQNNIASQCYFGVGRFKKAQKENRLVAVMFPSHYHLLVTKRSGIKKLTDIKGKRFIPGRKRSGNISTTKAIFGVFGFGYKDFKVDYLGQREAVQAVRDGKVDGTFVVGGAPIGTIVEALTIAGGRLNLVPFSQAVMDKVNKKHPWIVNGFVRGGLYKGWDKPTKTMMHSAFLITKKGFSADLVYKVVKSTFENLGRLQKGHSTFKNMTIKDLKGGMSIGVPLHEGAKRYYKEVGAL